MERCVMCALKNEVEVLPLGRLLYKWGLLTKEIFQDLQKLGVNESIKWRSLLHSINFQESKAARVALVELVRLQNAEIAAKLDKPEFNGQIVCICGQRANFPRLKRSNSLQEICEGGIYSTMDEYMEPLFPHNRYRPQQDFLSSSFQTPSSHMTQMGPAPLRKTKSLEILPTHRLSLHSSKDCSLSEDQTYLPRKSFDTDSLTPTPSPGGRDDFSEYSVADQDTIFTFDDKMGDCPEPDYDSDGQTNLFSMICQRITDLNDKLADLSDDKGSELTADEDEDVFSADSNASLTPPRGLSINNRGVGSCYDPTINEGPVETQANHSQLSSLDSGFGQDESIQKSLDDTTSVHNMIRELRLPPVHDQNVRWSANSVKGNGRELPPFVTSDQESPAVISPREEQGIPTVIDATEKKILGSIMGVLFILLVIFVFVVPRDLICSLLLHRCLSVYAKRRKKNQPSMVYSNMILF